MSWPSVNIILSTYNGSLYIKEQLESLYAQDYPNLKIFVRDDGSSDSSLEILRAESAKGRLTLFDGQNIGIFNSFLELLKIAAPADYYALCDQDDIWLPNKVSKAISKLKDQKSPALYCSSLMLVDSELKELKQFAYDDAIGFKNSIFTNCATGCSCVFNIALKDLFIRTKDPSKIIMHDWWLYIIASAFGEVIYDKDYYILYRQHANNQIGMQSIFKIFKNRLFRLFVCSQVPNRFSQVTEFKATYGSILKNDITNYLNKIIDNQNTFYGRLYIALRLRPARKYISQNVSSFFLTLFKH